MRDRNPIARKRGSLRFELAVALVLPSEPGGVADANSVGLVLEAMVEGAFSRFPAPGNTNTLPDFPGCAPGLEALALEALDFWLTGLEVASLVLPHGFVVVLTDSPRIVVGVRGRFFRASAWGALNAVTQSKPSKPARIVATNRKTDVRLGI